MKDFDHGIHRKTGIKMFLNHETHERHEKALDGVESEIVRELLELRGMVGL